MYSLFAWHDNVTKAWFAFAAWIHAVGEKDVSAVDGMERHRLPIKRHFSRILKGVSPPDLEQVMQYIPSTTVTMLMTSNRAKQLKVQHLSEQHQCHLENDLADPSCKSLAE